MFVEHVVFIAVNMGYVYVFFASAAVSGCGHVWVFLCLRVVFALFSHCVVECSETVSSHLCDSHWFFSDNFVCQIASTMPIDPNNAPADAAAPAIGAQPQTGPPPARLEWNAVGVH